MSNLVRVRASKPGRDRPQFQHCGEPLTDDGDDWDAPISARCTRRVQPGEVACREHADVAPTD